MAEEHKTDQNPEELTDLSPEELQQRIQEEKKNAKRSLRFAFTALIAIIAVCIAWFAANNRVSMTGTQISADNDALFDLASVGSRQLAEKNNLKDDNKNNILSSGTQVSYESYIDINSGGTVSTPQTYYKGSSGLAWYLNGQESLAPGSSGKLEFYLIPKRDNLSEVKVKLNLIGYTTRTDGTAGELNNKKIQSLLNGHILFFQYLDDTYGYHGWLGGEDKELTIKAPQATATFKKDMPYKVTLYWKWPQYFRNYIYTDRSTQGDLFTNAVEQSEYSKLNTFINEQKKVNDSKLFYDAAATDDTQIAGEINNQMNDATLNTCSNYYNQADEYIGKNAKYVYVQIQVNPAD